MVVGRKAVERGLKPARTNDMKQTQTLPIAEAAPLGIGFEDLLACVYGISRWSNPNRSAARHIDDGTGKPLCGNQRHKFWQTETATPTCESCKRKQANDKLTDAAPKNQKP
jgi:hypothetical protein